MASTELPRLRGSINALKGHLTRTLDQVDKFLIHSVNETTRDSALSFQNEITKRHEMLEEAVLAASSISEEEYDVQWEGMVKYEERVASARASIAKLLTDLNQSASESLLNASTSSTAASSGSAGKRPFDVNLLRPFLLTPEHAPADFRSWKEEFASFYSGYGMEHHPLEQQQALFRKCISSEFWEHIRLQIHASLPVYSATSGPSCLRVLEDTFWHLYPAFTRRLEYEETGPETGESPLAFLKRLVQLFEDSSIVEVDEKDRLVFKFLSRYPDPWIRGRIMELKTPVFSDLWRIAEARENKSSRTPPSPRSLNASWRCTLHLPLPRSRRLCLMDRAQRRTRWQWRRPSIRHGLNGRRGSTRRSNLHHHHLHRSGVPSAALRTSRRTRASLTRGIWFVRVAASTAMHVVLVRR